MAIIIGTAGWSIARQHATSFPADGSALERYAARLGGVEINSSFYRPHRAATWARWAASVPAHFRFAVKIPRTISHERRLVGCEADVARFLDESAGLGEKLAVLLLQLPPSLAYAAGPAGDFLAMLGQATAAKIVCEPRHASWFETDADRALADLDVARVAADPARVPRAAVPGGARGIDYWRLHGSPDMYRSAYGAKRLAAYAEALERARAEGRTAWCVFDNTAAGAALGDALALQQSTD